MHNIPRISYLANALRLTVDEEKLIAQFGEWLPDSFIDCHAHCNLDLHVDEVSPRAMAHMLSTFPSYSLEESKLLKEIFHPGKTIRTLRFAKTFRGINHRAANQYLLETSPPEDRVALFGLPEDPHYTIDMLQHPRVSALKMYYSYLEPPAETIYECFPPKILAAAQGSGIPIILHLPRMIVYSIDDLEAVLRDFPDLIVVIAHLGLSKMLVPGLKEAYDRLVPYSNVVFDTALNPSSDVVALALKCFGPDRILYGSDEPLHLIRSKAYEHPTKGQRIIIEYAYHWADKEEQQAYKALAEGAVHAHWSSLNAIRGALERTPGLNADLVKEKIFLRNAERVFGFGIKT